MDLFSLASKTVVNSILQYKYLNRLPIAQPILKHLQDVFPTVYNTNKEIQKNSHQVTLVAQQGLNRDVYETLLNSKQPFPEGLLKLTFEYFKRYRYAAEDDFYFLCKYCAFERIPHEIKYYTYLITETTVEHAITLNAKFREQKYFCRHCITTPLITVTSLDAEDTISPVTYQPCLFIAY